MSGAAPSPPSSSVSAAVTLMYAGAGLSASMGVLRMLDPDAFREALGVDDGDELGQMSGDSQLAGYVIGALLTAALWLVVAWACRRGRAGGRVAATVFGSLYTLATVVFIVGTVAPSPSLLWNTYTVLSTVIMTVAVAVVWLLYRPDANQYFSGSREGGKTAL